MANPFDSKTLTKENAAAKTNDLYEWLRLEGHDYSILSSGEIRKFTNLVFSHKDCKFYKAARVEADAKFMADYAPYLRWEFDQIEDELQEVEVEEEYKTKSGNSSTRKVKKMVPTGRKINKFPPTTENILKKKVEVMSALYSNSQNPSSKEVAQAFRVCVPRLSDTEYTEELVNRKGAPGLERLRQQFARTV